MTVTRVQTATSNENTASDKQLGDAIQSGTWL